MKVELQGVVADCPSCHGTDFEPAGGERELVASHTPMVCARCGTRTTYIQLLVQIGDKAIARAAETFDRIKAQRAQIRSKPRPKPK